MPKQTQNMVAVTIIKGGTMTEFIGNLMGIGGLVAFGVFMVLIIIVGVNTR